MNGHTFVTRIRREAKTEVQESCEYKNLSNNSKPAGFINLRFCLPGVISEGIQSFDLGLRGIHPYEYPKSPNQPLILLRSKKNKIVSKMSVSFQQLQQKQIDSCKYPGFVCFETYFNG